MGWLLVWLSLLADPPDLKPGQLVDKPLGTTTVPAVLGHERLGASDNFLRNNYSS
jgi:hypothetical protein